MGGQHPLAVTFGTKEDGIAWFVAVRLAVMLEHENEQRYSSFQWLSGTLNEINRSEKYLCVAAGSQSLTTPVTPQAGAMPVFPQRRHLLG